MDKVIIEALRVDTIIGIHPWERRVRQSLYVDMDLHVDIAAAAASGDLADSVDYHAVSVMTQQFIRAGEFQLLETLADRLADRILADFPVTSLRLRVRKPGAVADAESVGVEVLRGAIRQ